MKKECEFCEKELTGRWLPNKRFCNRKCYNKRNQQLASLKNVKLPVPCYVVGTISEYRVCVDLMAKGFEVFKNICLQGRCDLVILKDKKTYTLEVTTGFYSFNGSIQHPKKWKEKTWDFLAVVTTHGDIFYEPNLPLKEE
jgi:hypothetical protein